MMRRFTWMAVALGLMAVPSSSRAGMVIVINPNASLSNDAAALAALDRAAQRWASRIDDPITINITAGLAGLSGGVNAQTGTSLFQDSFTTVRNALVVDAADEPADAVVQALPTAAQFSALLPPGSFSLSGNITLSSANAKALGLLNPTAGNDGTIAFNSQSAFDFDSSNGVSPGTVDFESVAAREIGHVLGFLSAVDDVDGSSPHAISLFPLDLFRFQNNVAGRDPSTLSEFTTFPRFLLPGGDAIFDDLGTERRLSTGVSEGDGRPAIHWKDDLLTGVYIGVMDPTISAGIVTPNTDADFRAMSLIGYDVVAVAVAVPEPASLVMAGTAAAFGMGSWLRRRRHLAA